MTFKEFSLGLYDIFIQSIKGGHENYKHHRIGCLLVSFSAHSPFTREQPKLQTGRCLHDPGAFPHQCRSSLTLRACWSPQLRILSSVSPEDSFLAPSHSHPLSLLLTVGMNSLLHCRLFSVFTISEWLK